MLLMIKKFIRGGICNAVYRYAKANNKYMRDYDKRKETAKHGWAMSQKLPTFNFEWVGDTSQFNEAFIKNYDEQSGYILEVVQYRKNLCELHSDLSFLPEKKKLGKAQKLVTNLEDKSEYFIHIKILKRALKHGLILKKVYRVISCNQDKWLKPQIEMNNKLRIETKNDFQKEFFKLMYKSAFGKAMENVRKYKDIKLVKPERRRNYLVSEPNYYSTKFFVENLPAIEIKQTQITMNKSVYLGLSILDLSETVTQEFQYDYIKPK